MNIFKKNPLPNTQTKTNFGIPFLISALLLCALTIVMFSGVIFSSKDIVLSSENTDTYRQFIHWREFGFSELQKGNLALWNPYIFSGMPFLGEFQSALLYPLNLIYALIPLPKAINLSVALHIFLAGIFMYLWVSHHKLHPLACFFSSVLFMFCGAHFLHIYAGHLPNLCAIIWAPLIFLSIDGLSECRSYGWLFLGMFAVTMQILAGHPQYVFYTTVAALAYSGFYLIKTKHRIKIILGIFIIYGGAFALGAVQILPGIQAAGESIRSGGTSFEFASMFSFPPENFITLLVPAFFGNNISFPYWGRCYLWEMSLFLSVTAFMLAIYGSIYNNKTIRNLSLTMALFLLLLALGSHTPLFHFLYTWIPGFNLFRGSSKFIFLASLFIILLAGSGLDQIIRSQLIPKAIIIIVLFTGVLFIAFSFYLQNPAVIKTADGLWSHLLQMMQATRESYFVTEYYRNPVFVQQAKLFTAKQILIAGCTCLLIALLFYLRRFSHRISHIIALLAIFEIFIFANQSLAYFDFSLTQPSTLKEFSIKHHGDYRILYFDNPNIAMSLKLQNIWGDDPTILGRYAEFMTFTQGYNPNAASQYLSFSRFHPLYNMLRCRYIFSKGENGINIIDTGVSMPRLLLIRDWLLITKRDNIFAAMQNITFDPRKTVILETPPDPLPIKLPQQDIVKITDSSTDHLNVKADLAAPAILLLTDVYSSGWRAKALPGSVQKRYKIMPANYILCAVPLSKGNHYFRLEYLPSGFLVGKWISLISLVIYVGFLVVWFFIKSLHYKQDGKYFLF